MSSPQRSPSAPPMIAALAGALVIPSLLSVGKPSISGRSSAAPHRDELQALVVCCCSALRRECAATTMASADFWIPIDRRSTIPARGKNPDLPGTA